jgi:ABC-type nitrate/sulfonate/bicarbonate transport system substrate-binding protein
MSANEIRVGIHRRDFLQFLAAGGAAVAGGSLRPASAGAVTNITAGWQVKWGGQLVANYPEVERRFNVKFKVVTFPHTVAAMQALTSGNIDVTHLTTQHFVRAIDENLNLYLVCGLCAGLIEFDVHKNVPVAYGDWAGLKQYAAKRQAEGKPFTIGVPTGSYQHLMVNWQFARHGIDPAKDVKLLNINFPEHPRIMELGQVDMVSTISVFGASIVVGGHGRVFYYPYDAPSGIQNVSFAVRKETLEKNPQMVEVFVQSHVALLRRIMDSPDQLLDDQVRYSGLPRGILEHDLKNTGFSFHIRVADIRGMANMMHEVGWTKQNRSGELERFIEWRYLTKATGMSEPQLKTWEWRPKV